MRNWPPSGRSTATPASCRRCRAPSSSTTSRRPDPRPTRGPGASPPGPLSRVDSEHRWTLRVRVGVPPLARERLGDPATTTGALRGDHRQLAGTEGAEGQDTHRPPVEVEPGGPPRQLNPEECSESTAREPVGGHTGTGELEGEQVVVGQGAPDA